MSYMFLVLATYGTGHGDVTTPVFITDNVFQAVITAQQITRFGNTYGYTFYSHEHVVCVYKLSSNTVYCKTDFTWNLGQKPPKSCIMTVRYFPDEGGQWEEEWYDMNLQAQFLGKKS